MIVLENFEGVVLKRASCGVVDLREADFKMWLADELARVYDS